MLDEPLRETEASLVRCRLLVVDDDVTQRRLVQCVAERAGFGVDAVGDAASAVQRLGASTYASVVLDLSLGDQDGIVVLHAIAASRVRPQLILITGFDDRIRQAASRLARNLGLSLAGALRKPFIPGELTQLLTRRAFAAEQASNSFQGSRISRGHIEDALDAREIVLAYQPKVELSSGRTIGVEALARWHSPTLGAVPPAVLMQVAEHHGLTRALTIHLLEQAAQGCAILQRIHPGFSVAVNIAPVLLSDLSLPDQIDSLIVAHGLAPHSIMLEVTESSGIGPGSPAVEVLTRLRIKGIAISIDDFGTGYSSLLSLMQMPFSELKIDQSFARCCDVDEDAWKIVQASLFLAGKFGMKVVAEGVESTAVADRLRDAGCDIAQGWLYAYAMPIRNLSEWLVRN